MSDVPGRRTYDPPAGEAGSDDRGRGSPVPEEYGDLWPQRPPAPEGGVDGLDGLDGVDGATVTSAPWGRRSRRERDATVDPRVAAAAVATAAVTWPAAGVPNGPGSSVPYGAPGGPGGPGSAGWPAPGPGAPTAVNPVYRPVAMPMGQPADLNGLSRRQRQAARRAMRSRSRATVRHVDILTVARVSVLFYLVVLCVVVVASVLLWYAANTFGTLPSMEKSIRTLFSLKTFTIHPTEVAEYTSGFGLVIAVAGILANIILALIYNLIAEVVGGIRVEVESYPSE